MTLHLAPCPRCYLIECPCGEKPDPLVVGAVEKRHRDARERALIRAGWNVQERADTARAAS